jgi:site-specific DNA-cytosine methylase
VDVLRRHQPQFVILENVKRLLTMERGFHFATILSSLAESDYTLEWRLLNAMHFGLPQNRQRVFILGIRNNAPPSDSVPPPLRLATAEDLGALTGRQLDSLADPSPRPALPDLGGGSRGSLLRGRPGYLLLADPRGAPASCAAGGSGAGIRLYRSDSEMAGREHAR